MPKSQSQWKTVALQKIRPRPQWIFFVEYIVPANELLQLDAASLLSSGS